jgi:hypothetical protein
MAERNNRRSAEMAKLWYMDFAANWVAGGGIGYTIGTAIETPQSPNYYAFGVAIGAILYSFSTYHDVSSHIADERNKSNPSDKTREFITKQLDKLIGLKISTFLSGSLTTMGQQGLLWDLNQKNVSLELEVLLIMR